MDLLDDDGNPIDADGKSTDAKYRKRGPEKNHRPDPIVEMGLLMDKNGIPIAYDLFPGNESEKVHMRPIINRIKKDFSDKRALKKCPPLKIVCFYWNLKWRQNQIL